MKCPPPVMGHDLIRALCKALGLEGRPVRKITIVVDMDKCVEVTIEELMDQTGPLGTTEGKIVDAIYQASKESADSTRDPQKDGELVDITTQRNQRLRTYYPKGT